jgi:hypothetical protein
MEPQTGSLLQFKRREILKMCVCIMFSGNYSALNLPRYFPQNPGKGLAAGQGIMLGNPLPEPQHGISLYSKSQVMS